MKSLATIIALLLTGCSVEISHQSEDEEQKSRTTVAVDLLDETTPLDEPNASNTSQLPSVMQSQTVVVPAPSIVVISEPSPTVTRSPDQSIRVAGSDNTVILGVHIHNHEHFHIYQPLKPVLVNVDVRIEVDGRISGRERRCRMVERRISRAFPCYGK